MKSTFKENRLFRLDKIISLNRNVLIFAQTKLQTSFFKIKHKIFVHSADIPCYMPEECPYRLHIYFVLQLNPGGVIKKHYIINPN